MKSKLKWTISSLGKNIKLCYFLFDILVQRKTQDRRAISKCSKQQSHSRLVFQFFENPNFYDDKFQGRKPISQCHQQILLWLKWSRIRKKPFTFLCKQIIKVVCKQKVWSMGTDCWYPFYCCLINKRCIYPVIKQA